MVLVWPFLETDPLKLVLKVGPLSPPPPPPLFPHPDQWPLSSYISVLITQPTLLIHNTSIHSPLTILLFSWLSFSPTHCPTSPSFRFLMFPWPNSVLHFHPPVDFEKGQFLLSHSWPSPPLSPCLEIPYLLRPFSHYSLTLTSPFPLARSLAEPIYIYVSLLPSISVFLRFTQDSALSWLFG
jgi:hypothetical protein